MEINLHYIIKLANMIFAVDLGIILLWLLVSSLTFDKVRRSSTSKRAELFIKVFRDGAPFLKVVPSKSHYLIGRGPECDIRINGEGVPLKVGEFRFKGGGNFFKKFPHNLVYINGCPMDEAEVGISPDDELICYGYTIMLIGNPE